MIKIGDKVRMSEALKVKFIGPCAEEHQKHDWRYAPDYCSACAKWQVDEFGDCVGTVEAFTKFNDGICDDAVDVCWAPSNSKYSYEIVDLELVEENE